MSAAVLGTDFVVPTLVTERLRLRAFRPADALRLERLAAAAEIVAPTLLPHAYDCSSGEAWIHSQAQHIAAGRLVNWAIETAATDAVIGSAGLVLDREQGHGQFACWLGVEHWGHGYAAEAGRSVLAFGFRELGLRRVWASNFAANESSVRLMERLGLTREGVQRRHVLRLGRQEDVLLWGLLREDYERNEHLRWVAASARVIGAARERMHQGDG